MTPPAAVTSGLSQPMACSASRDLVVSWFAWRIAAPTSFRIEVMVSVIWANSARTSESAVSYRKIACLEIRSREMLRIGQRGPLQEILRAFRHVRNHLEQHDGFVEMIEVV